jgi:AcrR family transcriptional regulator
MIDRSVYIIKLMPTEVPKGRRESPARRRILDTATALFYAEGVHAVGIDRIIAEAGVAKATFYHHFPAKDELVRAYVQQQSQVQRETAARLPEVAPRDMLLAVFDAVADLMRDPSYRGCPFVNAAAEYPDSSHPVRQAIADHRRWFRELLRNLLVADGHADAERTADILVALKDGLLVGCDLDDPARRGLIRDAVTRLIDGAAGYEGAAAYGSAPEAAGSETAGLMRSGGTADQEETWA